MSIGRAISIVLALLLCTACSIAVDESRFFYPGPSAGHAWPQQGGVSVEALRLTAQDGASLVGIRLTQPNADVEVLYFGGNASRADDMVAFLAPIIGGLRVNLTMIDYRGYGRSAGVPTIAALKSDALETFDTVRSRAAGKPVVVHGVSLGGFVACYVATHRPVQALVLESTAPDASAWAHAQVPFYARPLIRVRVTPALLRESNAEALRHYAGPLLVMTGSKDDVTPPRFVKALVDASPSPVKQTILAKGAGHGTTLTVAEARGAYRAFLDASHRSDEDTQARMRPIPHRERRYQLFS